MCFQSYINRDFYRIARDGKQLLRLAKLPQHRKERNHRLVTLCNATSLCDEFMPPLFCSLLVNHIRRKRPGQVKNNDLAEGTRYSIKAPKNGGHEIFASALPGLV